MKWSGAISVIIAALAMSEAQAQPLGNPGFETRSALGQPTGWNMGGDGYELAVDSVSPHSGRYSLRTQWRGSSAYAEDSRKFATASQLFPVARAAGRRLRLTGYIRSERITVGFAGLWMRVDGPPGTPVLAFDNMGTRGVRGTTPWTRHVIELPVDSGASAVYIGVLHPGDGTAWFDSIAVEVFGDPMPRRAASFRPPPRPAEDLTRLLSDAELALPVDSVPVVENEAFARWIAVNARPIRSLGATDFSDLRFLEPLLRGKRIVQLGESGHGVAEFNLAKVRLIKYLHQELGFDVIAFESSLFECDRAGRAASTLAPIDLMRSCIFAVWHTDEVLPLFEYIRETQRTNRPLILTGFDEQASSPAARARPAFLRSLVSVVDSVYAQQVFTTDSAFQANSRADYAQANERRLITFYDSLATFLSTHRSTIEAAHRDDPVAAILGRQTAVSMAVFARQLAQGPTRIGSEVRDLGMANNLDFLLDEVYPGRKVMVWAHNFHIQHRENTRTSPRDTSSAAMRTMGTWVAERHRQQLYTIGLFMYRGNASMNNRVPYPIALSRSGSLESILHRAPWRYSFVDLSQARRESGSEWMWRPLTALSWGTQPEQIVPRDEYDGLLFIDTVHLPRYR